MRVFAIVLCCILIMGCLICGSKPLIPAVALLFMNCMIALPYARSRQYSAHTTRVLVLVAIIGFLGVRLLRPIFEGFMIYSGPGTIADQIHFISHGIDDFKRDNGGKLPSLLDLNSGWLKTNPLNGNSAVADKPGPGIGWVYRITGTEYTFSAVNAKGNAVLSKDEANYCYVREGERAYVASQRAWNNWGGLLFAIPLAVYGLALLGWHLSRRARRIAHGLCPICGYDLRAHLPNQICPECGTQIPRFGWRSGKI